MATTKHTPGPWTLSSGNPIKIFKNQGVALPIADVKVDLWDRMSSDEAIANARLIAAAPDLLDSCIGMIEYLDKNYPWSLSEPLKSLKSGMVAAIAKATTIELSK